MKRLIPVVLFSLVACGQTEGLQDQQSEIAQLPSVESGQGSRLAAPTSCPIWAPGGGDVDTPEAPFPDHVSKLCAVDDTGRGYGIVGGDAPTAQLAVIPGNHELGLYIGVDSSAQFTPDRAILSGGSADIEAWAAPTNVLSQDCCAEDHQTGRLTLRMVAVGNRGMLLSFGTFDGMPTQVAFDLDTGALFGSGPTNGGWFGRFYVNGVP